MLEAQPRLGSGAKELDALLAEATLREKRSRRRAIFYTIIPVVVGLVFLGFSLYKVSQLQRTATNLNGQIKSQTEELKLKRDELSTLETETKEAVEKLKVVTTILNSQDNPQQKTKQALQVINRPDSGSNRGNSNTQGSEPVPAQSAGTNSSWVIVIGRDRDLDEARARARLVRSRGYPHSILICEREGHWRTMMVFPTKAVAVANFGQIRADFKKEEPYRRELNDWCRNLTQPEPGVCKCQN